MFVVAIAPEQINNRQVELTAEQKHYLFRVVRLGVGDRFIAMNGKGDRWQAILQTNDSDKSKLIAVLEAEILVKNELPVEIKLIAALPKNGFDEIVRCCTEIGVTSIFPVISSRTLLKPSPQKLLRWQRIATEAAEQSERQIVPTIFEPSNFPGVLSLVDSQQSGFEEKYICVARKNSPHLLDCLLEKMMFKCQGRTGEIQIEAELLTNNFPSIIIATGPEGGWTDAEVEEAIALSFQPVSLGQRILRAVTAPLVALSLVAGILEREIGSDG